MNVDSALVRRWMAFNLVGAAGIAVQLTMLALLTEVLEAKTSVATLTAVEAAVLHNFFWHCRFTWREHFQPCWQGIVSQLLRFHLSNGVISLLGNLLLMQLWVEVLGMRRLPAGLLSIAICSLFNFAAVH